MMSYIEKKVLYSNTDDRCEHHMISLVCAHDILTHACVARGGEGWKVGGIL